MMKLPISVIILTYNEENNIENCLKSICNLFNEIFIVDSYSTDQTLAIAIRYTKKIYQHSFENYAHQRNWAQDKLPIKNQWIFHLDADERISPELTAELIKIFSSEVKADGFMISRKTIFRNKWIKHGGHYPVYHLRIFKKDKGRVEERLYDQHYIVNGKILKVKGDMINIIDTNLKTWRARHRKWAELEAKELFYKRLNINFFGSPIKRRRWLRYNVYYRLPLFMRPFLYFFYRYVLLLGFLDGIEGMLFHFWQGLWYRLLVDMNIRELKKQCIY